MYKLSLSLGLIAGVIGFAPQVLAEIRFYAVTVNDNGDELVADEYLTLREAIALTNNTLNYADLSVAEQKVVKPVADHSVIGFDLPSGKTEIRLGSLLPPLLSPNLLLDGTTQAGYDPDKSAIAEMMSPRPVVSLVPDVPQTVSRGLAIAADGVTVQGLSIYGFNAEHGKTVETLTADIFIDNRLELREYKGVQPWDALKLEQPPVGVTVRQNWLGLPPDESIADQASAFGVWLYRGVDTVIENNRIANHQGSAVITGAIATNAQIHDNVITGNGTAGMPDAIRLEGDISAIEVKNNLLCGNDGAAIYMFNPTGAATITQNQLKFNGRRLRRSAIYLMGNDHQVLNNDIRHQAAAGVVVAGTPKSDRNRILGNTFGFLEGLSIDLVTRRDRQVHTFETGDGVNPERSSPNRRKDTGNGSINAPQFLSQTVFLLNGRVNFDGKADPNSDIIFYRVLENTENHGVLSEVLATTRSDEKGNFSLTSTDLKAGEMISAIAHDSDYGTSEPAQNVVISTPDGQAETATTAIPSLPTCTSKPLEPPVEEPPVEEQIILRVPNNVHFALDQSSLSPESTKILDQIAAVLEQHPYIVIDLHGHTDSRASLDYNIALGQRRSQAVRQYLLKKGIDPARITMRTFGETQLLSNRDDILDHARNRRVEVVFTDLQGLEIVIEPQEGDLQLER